MTTRTPLLEPAFLRQLDRLSLVTKRVMAGELQGERRSPRRGASVEFADFRHYTSGDDIRQVDWKLYARMERIFLKLFVAEDELSFHLLIDTSASMNWGDPLKLHYAKRLAAAFGYLALTNLDRVSVSACATAARSPQLPGVRGKRGAVPLFSFLQQLAPGGSADLAQFCRRYIQTARMPGPLLLCSDLLDPHWKEALEALTRRPFDVTVLHILAPQELRPLLDGDFRLMDSESGPAVEVSADADLLQRYAAHLRNWQGEIENFCHGRRMSYLQIDTAVPVEEFVLGYMRRRGLVR
jgi:uncharacterized protein (DUF58 family)